jgi:GMP synthase-like glutamine amidotransferase
MSSRESASFEVPGLPERSVLYVSANVAPDHPLRAAVVTHMDPLPDLDLGRITSSLGDGSRRYFVERVLDGTSEQLPRDLSGLRGLVVGCSSYSANLERGPLAPWQERVVALIRLAVLEYKLPYLGLCGGGQLGLVALGGRVGPNPAGVGVAASQPGSIAIRTTEVELTEAGRRDPLFLGVPPTFGMTAIHADYMAEVPSEGFTVLAHSRDIPNQVVAFGDRVRLLGLHPEVTREFLARTIEPVIAAGAFGSVPRPALREAFANLCPTPESNRLILQNFLTHFCARKWQA